MSDPPSARPARDVGVGLAFILLVAATYLATSFGVGNLYPFSTFDMYAGDGASTASRVAVERADGTVEDASVQAAFVCPVPLAERLERCRRLEDVSFVGYLREEFLRLQVAGPLTDAEPARLVLLTWHALPDGGWRAGRCELATCQVQR